MVNLLFETHANDNDTALYIRERGPWGESFIAFPRGPASELAADLRRQAWRNITRCGLMVLVGSVMAVIVSEMASAFVQGWYVLIGAAVLVNLPVVIHVARSVSRFTVDGHLHRISRTDRGSKAILDAFLEITQAEKDFIVGMNDMVASGQAAASAAPDAVARICQHHKDRRFARALKAVGISVAG